jgi:predicted nucleic-acid-binding protein
MPRRQGVGMRKAIDTNVLVRLKLVDNSEQSRRANALLANHILFVSKTVLLETEWVLRSVYKLEPTVIAGYLQTFLEFPVLEFEDYDVVQLSVDAMKDGMDFADALHLFSAKECDQFFSFDKNFRQAAQAHNNAVEVIAP